MARVIWAVDGGAGSVVSGRGGEAWLRKASRARATNRRQASGASARVACMTAAVAISSSTRSSPTKSSRSVPAALARSMTVMSRSLAVRRSSSTCSSAESVMDSRSDRPRSPACSSQIRSTNPAKPSHGSGAASACRAASAYWATFSMSAAATSFSRVGKRRYKVAMPTPARAAIASSGASSPCSANMSRATATMAARLRAASARSRRSACAQPAGSASSPGSPGSPAAPATTGSGWSRTVMRFIVSDVEGSLRTSPGHE